MKAEKGRKLQKKCLDLTKVGSWDWSKAAIYLHYIKVQHEAVGTEGEAVTSYAEDLAKIMDEGSYYTKKSQIFNVD